MTCGILHGSLLTYSAHPVDREGCVLPDGHEGPHEFVAEDSSRWLWETDMSCDCEHCARCEGDYCTVYWPKHYRATAEPNPPTVTMSNTKAPHTIVKLPPLPEPESRERVYGGHGDEIVHYWYSAHQMREYARQAVHEAEDAWQSRCTALAQEAWTWSKALEAVTSAKLTDEQIDAIAADGMRNAAGGIYATSVYDFARAIERAAKSAA